MTKHSAQSDGFTLVEILVIAPVVILAIGGFVALMTSMVGDIMMARESNKLTYDSQDSLSRIEQDIRLSTQFLTTTGSLPTPQGSNDGSTAFTNTSNTLILTEIATDKNPVDTTRQPIYYANQPNPCGGTQTANQMYLTKVIYYLKGGSLWRRTILPAWNTNAAIDGDTICSAPWQQNSCSPGYATGNQCQTNDVEVMKRVTSLGVQYFSTPDGTLDLGATGAPNASTVKVTIGAQATTAGRTSNSSEAVRASKLNGVVTTADTAPLSVIVQPTNITTLTSDHSVSFTSQASSSAATVQWQRSDNGGGTWTNVAGATTPTLSLPNVDMSYDGAQYRAVFTRSTLSTTSNAAVLSLSNWGSIAIQNGWSSFSDPPYSSSGYTITTSGMIMLKGLIKKSGTPVNGEKIGQLPSGYWPSARLIFGVSSNNAAHTGRIDIDTSGQILFVEGDPSWISLEGINFMPSSTTFTPLTLTNSWVNFGSPYSNAQYAVDSVGRTHTQGLVKSGGVTDGTQIVNNLPAAQRTGEYLHVPTRTSGNGFGYIGVDPTSGIVAKGAATSNASLDNHAMFYPGSFSANWINLGLQNGWVAYPSFSTPQYIKGSDNVVMLKGLIRSGTVADGTVITCLPAGYRPKDRTLIGGGVSNTNPVRYDVRSDGCVEIYYGSNVWTSLDAITFLAEQ
jgi:hypothetical protein